MSLRNRSLRRLPIQRLKIVTSRGNLALPSKLVIALFRFAEQIHEISVNLNFSVLLFVSMAHFTPSLTPPVSIFWHFYTPLITKYPSSNTRWIVGQQLFAQLKTKPVELKEGQSGHYALFVVVFSFFSFLVVERDDRGYQSPLRPSNTRHFRSLPPYRPLAEISFPLLLPSFTDFSPPLAIAPPFPSPPSPLCHLLRFLLIHVSCLLVKWGGGSACVRLVRSRCGCLVL